ncbi:MAG: ABC transporter ATP-binding protein [Methylococcaceae bacterium]|nr:ABC transporter ATP-binding protein [Methylococcaceae bacterium]
MIAINNLSKSYTVGLMNVPVLKGINFTVAQGEFVAIMGPSGSGKSTLLNVLGILDDYDAGEYRLNGSLIQNLSEKHAAQYRSRLICFVFQSFNLLPFKTALENVTLPLYYQNVPAKQREQKALALLERLGLADRADHLPTELSGGQRQRVAIARVLANDPPLILADEPTGNLDSTSTEEVMRLFNEINREGRTLVMITHDESVATCANRIIRLKDGNIQTETKREAHV